ncbi:MAG: impB/mucB/samB family protein [Alphaproteobacteria bacterium]|nr:impB/mucB/samB family protein [Alphaproteobacteria bacterium]
MNDKLPITSDTAFTPPAELRWLYIDFNSYFASVEQQLDPRLRGKPVAVIPVETEATCAIAASYEAKAFGVKTGTPVYEAKKMCPGLICVLGRHEHYVEFHERILDEIDRHIPVTAVCSIDEMACKLMKNEMSPERVTAIAKSIKSGLAKNIGEYVRCSIGIAPSKYLAKVATDLQKPDGLTILMPEELPDRLHILSLRDLPGIGANMEKRLNHAGIYDMHALLKLQPKHMRAVWGSIWGEKMWYYLRGYDLPDQETERSSVGHSHVLSPDMRPPHQAYQVARRLTMKATARLRRMEYCAGRFSVSFRVENGPRLGLEAVCQPAQDSFVFLSLLEEMWSDLVREAKGARIKKVNVVLYGLVPEKDLHIQGDLFAPTIAPQQRIKSEKISRAMDQLNQKFGKDTVLLGMTPNQGKSFTGTKIAFTRIPDMEEFLE